MSDQSIDDLRNEFDEKLAAIAAKLETLVQLEVPAYELCEFYYFRNPILRPGFLPAYGWILHDAAIYVPEAWAYLQTAQGHLLCTTEAEWQAMSQAIWHTNADGTTVGWGGIGGVPFYVQDLAAGTIHLPDLRGMYAEAAGFDSLDVGGVHGDAIRNIWAEMLSTTNQQQLPIVYGIGGATRWEGYVHSGTPAVVPTGGTNVGHLISFRSSNIVPTASKNVPRAWAAFPCVYLGSSAASLDESVIQQMEADNRR